MKEQKGITLVALIVTIVVIIILAAVLIGTTFVDTFNQTNFTRQVSELTEVYDAVMQRCMENNLDAELYYFVGKDLTSEPMTINHITYGAGYYYISTTAEKQELGLERVKGNYIVNYKTGEVISCVRIPYDGNDYYTLNDLADVVQTGSTSAYEAEYDEAKGVNKPMVSKGMMPVVYDESTDNWVVTTEDDENWYDYANGKWATVMLMDELVLESHSNAQLRKMTREELNALKGESVVTPGSTFVWIPRYTYKEEASGETSIVYSKLTQDYLNNGYIKNPAFYFGEYQGANSDLTEEANSGYVAGGKELTGIWISKYEAGYSN